MILKTARIPLIVVLAMAAGMGPVFPSLAESAVQVQEYQGVSYVSGGIGLEEREELQSMASQFNLKLTFAMRSGDYISYVAVRITDTKGGTVLEATANGPLFYARLGQGSYKVQVSAAGQDFQRSVQVRSSQAQLDFYWN
ncbi:MAG: carboxypeptidase regulatory-like domain-containing protein [Gammaproteobacteria bacterium]|nr:carboxypeptidase regulatory-like domain-containing protein [Gammaproteobacteria bacterium]